MTRRAFTLIEMMVALTVMMILYTSVPDLVTQLQPPRNQRAFSDANMLAIALWGPNADHGGYMSDIGLPANGIGALGANDPSYISFTTGTAAPYLQQGEGLSNDLVFPPANVFSYPANNSVLTNALGVPVGWNGPYAGFDLTGLTVDPWGNVWQVNKTGQVFSAGPDGLYGTADDILSPNGNTTATGGTTLLASGGPMLRTYGASPAQVSITVRDVDGAYITNPAAIQIIVWGPNVTTTPRGQLSRQTLCAAGCTTTPTLDATSSAFIFGTAAVPVSVGRHAIEVYGSGTASTGCGESLLPTALPCAYLYGHGTVNVIGGSIANVEIRLRESSNKFGP